MRILRRTLAVALLATGAIIAAAVAQGVDLTENIGNYLTWQRANPQKSFEESAHPVAKDIYMDEVAAASVASGTFPHTVGSTFVKEATDPTDLRVTVITTMRKVDGFDPANGDWQYGMFQRQEDGTFAGGWMTAEGAAMCVGCHVQAADKDYTFLTYLGDDMMAQQGQ